MRIVIFCGTVEAQLEVSDKLLEIGDYVPFRTRHNRLVFEIDEKDIRIDIRPADILKVAGLRSDYALFYEASNDFIRSWEYNMKGRYTELKSLEDLIQLVIKEETDEKTI